MRRSITRAFVILAAGAAAGAMLTAGAAEAAERKVLGENFMRMGCSYCPSVGRAMAQLLEDFPDSIVGYQVHTTDSYATGWGTQRAQFYGITSVPTVYMDGVVKKVGSSGTDAANYAALKNLMNYRLGVPTDISIELGGEQVGTQSFTFTARVTMDADGTARTVRVIFVHTLADYPYSSDDRYFNCVRQGSYGDDVYLEPGTSAYADHTFTFYSTDWSLKEDLRIFAFVQTALTSKEIANAEMISWPFPPPPTEMPEDINGDGVVDVLDLLALLGAWGECPECPEDVTGDGVVDVLDLLAVLGAWS